MGWNIFRGRSRSGLLKECLLRMGAIYQEAPKFMNSKRADQPTDPYLMEFDVLREKAEARMMTGAGFPDEFAPIL